MGESERRERRRKNEKKRLREIKVKNKKEI